MKTVRKYFYSTGPGKSGQRVESRDSHPKHCYAVLARRQIHHDCFFRNLNEESLIHLQEPDDLQLWIHPLVRLAIGKRTINNPRSFSFSVKIFGV